MYLVPSKKRFDTQVDLFGLWDIVAYTPEGLLRWIQVKTNRKPGKAYLKKLAGFPAPGFKEVWIWKDRQKDPVILPVPSIDTFDVAPVAPRRTSSSTR